MAKKTDELILAYDFGTSGVKACLFNQEGIMLHKAFADYPTYLPAVSWVEQDPEEWWAAVVNCTRQLGEQLRTPQQIKAIGISGHMMGCLPVDQSGVPLRRSIIHSDKRSKDQCAQLERAIGAEEIYQITGNRIDPRYSICKLAWFKQNEPELYDKTYLFLQSKEYIIYKLTGVLGYTDYSDASLAGYLDIRTKEIADCVVEAAGIDRKKLPEVVPSTTIVGHVSAEASTILGLPEGIPVVLGGGDGACASAGAGAVEEGEAYNYLGSTSWINVVSSKPVFDPQRRTFNLYSLDPEQVNLGGGIQAAGSCLQWCKEQLGQVEEAFAKQIGISPYQLLDQAASTVPPGAEGLIFLPYLLGEKTPIWDPEAKGVFFGLSLRHTKNHMVRAVLEGVGYALRSVIETFEELGTNFKVINFTGGGTKGILWSQILADIFGKKIVIYKHALDAPALGAAIAAGIGYGWYANFKESKKMLKVDRQVEPDLNCHQHYSQLFSIYNGLYPQLKTSFHLLSQVERIGR